MVVLVQGRVDRERGDPKVLVDDISADFGPRNDREDKEHASQPRHQAPPQDSEGEPKSAEGDDEPMRTSTAPSALELAQSPGPAENPGSAHQEADRETTKKDDPAGGERAPQGRGAVHASATPDSREGDIESRAGSSDRHKVTVVLRATGDKLRDTRRMRRVQGLLTSFPGQDRYAFHIYEASREYLLEFPNSTTGFCSELLHQLEGLLGADNLRVESLVHD
jgi:hypothetical protein